MKAPFSTRASSKPTMAPGTTELGGMFSSGTVFQTNAEHGDVETRLCTAWTGRRAADEFVKANDNSSARRNLAVSATARSFRKLSAGRRFHPLYSLGPGVRPGWQCGGRRLSPLSSCRPRNRKCLEPPFKVARPTTRHPLRPLAAHTRFTASDLGGSPSSLIQGGDGLIWTRPTAPGNLLQRDGLQDVARRLELNARVQLPRGRVGGSPRSTVASRGDGNCCGTTVLGAPRGASSYHSWRGPEVRQLHRRSAPAPMPPSSRGLTATILHGAASGGPTGTGISFDSSIANAAP